MSDPRSDDRPQRRPDGGRSAQDRLEGDDYGGMGTQGSEWRHTDSGGGYEGEDRFGHSGGFQQGYGGQSGKAAWGPLSQGSTYGQGGPGWGHSGWESGRRSRPRGPQAGGGSYGQGYGDPSAQRSRDRTTQYDPNDREGFVAYGRAYGDAARDDDDHEPGYRDWRERQLAGHDADYGRWREEQARRYDSDYKAYRDERHETFSKGFHSWREDRAHASTADQAAPAAGGAGFDVVTDNVRSVSDGGEGHGKAESSKG